MGLGIQRPELLLLPLALILLWMLLDVVAVWVGMRVYDRSNGRRSAVSVRRGREGGEPSPEDEERPRLQRVCQWCNGKGKLPARIAPLVGIDPGPDLQDPECPQCSGAGYLDVPEQQRRWRAYRKKLIEQEWRER